MSLKLITALVGVFCSSMAIAHGQHGDVEDLPPPPKMEVAGEAAADAAPASVEESSAAKVEESKPQAAKPDPQ